MPRSIPLAALLTLTLPSALAIAGPLAQTARGVDNKSNTSSSSDSSNSNTTTSDDSSWYADDPGCTSCSSGDAVIQLDVDFGAEARTAVQKVLDSDGSFRLGGALLAGRVGLGLGFDHYFERIADKGVPPEDVRVNLFEVSALLRVLDKEPFKGDLRVGFAGATSTHFDNLPGGMIGAALTARANQHLALRVEGRAMLFEHGISAFEGAAGIAAGYLWLGYRTLKFDVGPPLEGPEVGLSFEL